MNKLKWSDIAGYSPYGLRCKVNDFGLYEIIGGSFNGGAIEVLDCCYCSKRVGMDLITPILKPMEMFDKYEYEKMCKVAFKIHSSGKLKNLSGIHGFSRDALMDLIGASDANEWFYQNHYDINNLIGKGLAVDVRTLGA